jgi:hypothetical protein
LNNSFFHLSCFFLVKYTYYSSYQTKFRFSCDMAKKFGALFTHFFPFSCVTYADVAPSQQQAGHSSAAQVQVMKESCKQACALGGLP